jgi:hypothetical protein
LTYSAYGQFGDASPVAILAHEWGHHVQGMAGFPSVDKAAELQADCYAGMYLRHLDDLGALDADDSLETLALFHSIGDDKLAPGEVRDWFDPRVHGDSQERTQAQGIGFATGDVEYCLDYALWADRPPIEIVDGVTIRQPPGTAVTTRRDEWVFDTLGATITVRIASQGTVASPEDALERELRAMAPSATTTLGPSTQSLLETRAWARGEGVRAPFDRLFEDRSAERGVAEILLDPRGVMQVFVAVEAEDESPANANRASEALDALLWGYCDPTAPLPIPCPSRQVTASPPRAAPLPTPEVAPPEEAPTRPKVRRRDLERLLLDRMSFGSCRPWRQQGQDQDPFSFGARAAVQCDDPAFGIKQTAMFIFPDGQSMDQYWRWRVNRIEPEPPRRRGACSSGDRGIRRWSHGELVCYVDRANSPRRAKIRWTDERTNTYGILDGESRSIAELYDWWSVIAG